MAELNGYDLSRQWFDFCFSNPEKINPNHTALYFFAIEHCNRLGWKEKFGLPTSMAKEAIGIKSYATYSKTLSDLVEWGFIEMIQKSKNQFSSNIVALSKNVKAPVKALDKAIVKHVSKQVESTCESIDSIDKPLTTNQGTINNNSLYATHEKIIEETVSNEIFLDESCMALNETDVGKFKEFCAGRLAEMKISGHSTKYPLGTVKNILIQDFKIEREKQRRYGQQNHNTGKRTGHDITAIDSEADRILREYQRSQHSTGNTGTDADVGNAA